MAEFNFDFCEESRVAEMIAPQEPEVKDFNGWVYNPTPTLPFRPTFKVTLEGLRWYLKPCGSRLDLITDRNRNAGRLQDFYRRHRQHVPFDFEHEYMGTIEVRFASPVNVPKGIKDSGGLIEPLELTMILHNATY